MRLTGTMEMSGIGPERTRLLVHRTHLKYLPARSSSQNIGITFVPPRLVIVHSNQSHSAGHCLLKSVKLCSPFTNSNLFHSVRHCSFLAQSNVLVGMVPRMHVQRKSGSRAM